MITLGPSNSRNSEEAFHEQIFVRVIQVVTAHRALVGGKLCRLATRKGTDAQKTFEGRVGSHRACYLQNGRIVAPESDLLFNSTIFRRVERIGTRKGTQSRRHS